MCTTYTAEREWGGVSRLAAPVKTLLYGFHRAYFQMLSARKYECGGGTKTFRNSNFAHNAVKLFRDCVVPLAVVGRDNCVRVVIVFSAPIGRFVTFDEVMVKVPFACRIRGSWPFFKPGFANRDLSSKFPSNASGDSVGLFFLGCFC